MRKTHWVSFWIHFMHHFFWVKEEVKLNYINISHESNIWHARADDSGTCHQVNFIEIRDHNNAQLYYIDQHSICFVILYSFENWIPTMTRRRKTRGTYNLSFLMSLYKVEESVIVDLVCILMQYNISPSNIKSYGMCSMSE